MHGHVMMAFLGTFFFVSLTPGMCMTLAMTLGMTIGVKRTLWMMIGELIGVGSVAVTSVIGVATVMLNYPHLFSILKYLGGAYLIYLAIQMWRARSKLALQHMPDNAKRQSRKALALQGWITAIANPKAWAFMVSLLPPFINANEPVAPQLTLLVAIILCSEFVCLTIYASGGKTLGHYLAHSGNLKWLNRISGALMALVGVWLAAS